MILLCFLLIGLCCYYLCNFFFGSGKPVILISCYSKRLYILLSALLSTNIHLIQLKLTQLYNTTQLDTITRVL